MAFRVFRLVTGAALGLLVLLLVWTGLKGLGLFGAGAGGEGAVAQPLLRLIGAVLIAGTYYYAFWGKSTLRTAMENIFAIPELLRKIAFTLLLLCIYRVGFHVPLPGVNLEKIDELVKSQEAGLFGEAMRHLSMLTGGNLQRSTLFGLGIMPYISASIIFQLLATVVPALEKLQKEGPAGYKKIQEYTRYATVGLCIIQAVFWMKYVRAAKLIYPEALAARPYSTFLIGVLGLTAGTIFLMWLGEQIDEYGIGNGISLLIMAGIVARLPTAILELARQSSLSLGGEARIGPEKILFLIGAFVFVVAGAILITQGQRRIPIQQAKHMRGRRAYGGQRHYMPLRVNHGGVMPIIFASSLMIFPGVILGWIAKTSWGDIAVIRGLQDAFRTGSYIYAVSYVGLIFFFAYFWTTVQFKPKEMAEQLRDYGHFIPGLRPGKRTAEYLERVMERITYCGAAFLSVIAVLPTTINVALKIPFAVSAFLGGTGLLITVSVALDLVQRIEANLVMRNYGGFLGGSSRIKGAY